MSQPKTAAVSLKEVVDALDMQSDSMEAYIHRRDGRIITLMDHELDGFDLDDDDEDLEDEQIEARDEARLIEEDKDFIALPSQFDINEYRIMERFSLQVEPQRDREILLNTIRGSGAFRRFKDMIHTLDMADAWYAFRNRAFARIAADFLDVNEIPWTNDVPGFTRDADEDDAGDGEE